MTITFCDFCGDRLGMRVGCDLKLGNTPHDICSNCMSKIGEFIKNKSFALASVPPATAVKQ